NIDWECYVFVCTQSGKEPGSSMSFNRRIRLASALVCAFLPLGLAWSQTQSQEKPQPSDQAKPVDQAKPQEPQQEPKKANPFETVPQSAPAPQPPKPQQPGEQAKPQLEAPKPTAPEAQPTVTAGNVVEAIEFRGARRVPQDTLRAQILTRKGDIYNEDALHRDFMILWNTGRFDDIRLETEQGTTGMIVRFVVT